MENNQSKIKANKKQNGSKSKANVNDNENVNVNENKNVNVNDSCVDGLQKIIDFYQENIGLITPYGVELFTTYVNEMPWEVIVFAMQKAVEANKKTIQYIKAILNNWQKAGIKTLADAKRESKVKNKMQEQREYDNLDFLYKNMEGQCEQ